MFGPDTSAPPLVAEGLVGFLVDRLGEELAALWERDRSRPSPSGRPGLAAQLEAVDGLLVLLRAGSLPSRLELGLLVHAYGSHPGFDPAWSRF